jgi:hypothetical protein
MRAKEKAERAQQEEHRAAVASIERVRKKIKYRQQHLIRYLLQHKVEFPVVPSGSQWFPVVPSGSQMSLCSAKLKLSSCFPHRIKIFSSLIHRTIVLLARTLAWVGLGLIIDIHA